jgi:hypothetical protein
MTSIYYRAWLYKCENGFPKSLHVSNVYFPNEVPLSGRVKYYFRSSEPFSTYEEYLFSLIVKQGWRSLEEAKSMLELPKERHIVVDSKEKIGFTFSGINEKLVIRNMLVLAGSGENSYHPEHPLIFSDKRMNRQIELKRIHLNEFYDLDGTEN